MTRKRSNPIKHINEPAPEPVKKRRSLKGKPAVALVLISIFSLVLFFNFYFNYTSGIAVDTTGTDMQTKYLLSGPDPYYNMRVVRWTLQDGHYPYGQTDPLLEYPMNQARGTGGGPRPPLMNMMAIALSFPLNIVMSASDAIGFAMQFLPALFGALLVFPIYFLGKELLNWKAGLVAALFLAITPVHLSSGHGSAFALFDHDALVLLLFVLIYLFYIRSIKSKDNTQGILYALLSGVMISALIMLWVESQYTYAVLMMFFAIQLLINLLWKKTDVKFIRNTIIAWSVGYLLALPMNMVAWHGIFRTDTALVLIAMAIVLGAYCIIVNKLKLPWTLSLPLLGGMGVLGLSIIHFAPATTLFGGFGKINSIIFGSGLYGSQTALTIAEAKTFDMSRWVMSFGPTLFLIAIICGLPYVLYKWYKTKRYDYAFIFIWFAVTTWLNTVAGRFINDYVPTVAILAGLVVYLVIEKIDYKKMVKKIRDVGGWHGVRKGVRVYHILGVLFIAVVVIMPNVYMSLDAAIPVNEQQKFGTSGVFGLSTYKEMYWNEALSWLAKQDAQISDTAKRPGFISWWDYGFQEIATGDHPTVADNYQRGVECAANFQTAPTETEAINVLSILLLRADSVNGQFSNATDSVLHKFLPDYNENVTNYDNATKTNVTSTIPHHPAKDIENIILDPVQYAPSFNTLVGAFKVTAMTALYHDSVAILNALSEEQTIDLYQDMQNITGYSVRYYGTEGYDMDIFNVFSFLAQKGTFGYSSMDDQYFQLTYTDKYNDTYSYADMQNITQSKYDLYQPFTPHQNTKDAFYQTMVVRTYRGTKDTYIPTYRLKHFLPEYISPYPYPGTNNPAVVITKYYPGGRINGTVSIGGTPFPGVTVAFLDQYDIPHDMFYAQDGTYSLTSLAGNFSLGYYIGQYLLKQVLYNGSSAISEAEADRKVPYTREINMTIDYANVTGHLSNSTSDMSIGFNNSYFSVGEQTVPIDQNGNYSISYLLPSEYTITVRSNGYSVLTETFFAAPGNQIHDISITSGILYGHISDNVGSMTLRVLKNGSPYGIISFNTTIRNYVTTPMPFGDYTFGFYQNDSATVSLYNLTVNVSPGAKEFDIALP
jgi:dolichyl-diphosphooligosaccharide--protein glycosyltransferase